MSTFRWSASAAVLVVLTLAAAPAPADIITHHFNINTPNGNPVTNLAIYSAAGGQDHVSLSPQVIAPSGVQSLTHSVPFSPTSVLIVGLNPDAAGTHVIMF